MISPFFLNEGPEEVRRHSEPIPSSSTAPAAVTSDESAKSVSISSPRGENSLPRGSSRTPWLDAIKSGTSGRSFEKMASNRGLVSPASANEKSMEKATSSGSSSRSSLGNSPPLVEASALVKARSSSWKNWSDDAIAKLIAKSKNLDPNQEAWRFKEEFEKHGYVSPPRCFFDEKKRLETLAKLQVVDTPPERSFDNLCRLAADILDAPVALISLIDGTRQWFKGNIGLDMQSVPRATSFCGWAISIDIERTEVFEVANASDDLRFRGNPLVVNEPCIRFYAGAVVYANNGAPLGTICVMDKKPRALLPKQRDLLLLLARQVEIELENRCAALDMRGAVSQAVAQSSLTDMLLRSAVPTAIATELRSMTKLPYERRFDEATVMFVDIVGFATLAIASPDKEMLPMLNDIFCAFDEVVIKRGLLKVKTLGDSYMVSSILQNRDNHAALTVFAAFEMLKVLDEYNKASGQSFQARIGVNSGPVIAGVLSTTQLTFDLWGDTVNVAARLESISTPGHITVSQYTKSLVMKTNQDVFEFVDRGENYIKGEGNMPVFYVKPRDANEIALAMARRGSAMSGGSLLSDNDDDDDDDEDEEARTSESSESAKTVEKTKTRMKASNDDDDDDEGVSNSEISQARQKPQLASVPNPVVARKMRKQASLISLEDAADGRRVSSMSTSGSNVVSDRTE